MLHALLIALAAGVGLGGVSAAITGVACYVRVPREYERGQETRT